MQYLVDFSVFGFGNFCLREAAQVVEMYDQNPKLAPGAMLYDETVSSYWDYMYRS